jgi:hypothetical protein
VRRRRRRRRRRKKREAGGGGGGEGLVMTVAVAVIGSKWVFAAAGSQWFVFG